MPFQGYKSIDLPETQFDGLRDNTASWEVHSSSRRHLKQNI
jgi:hypothetical protein